MTLLPACHENIWNQLNEHEKRIAHLEDICKQYNQTIISLQELVLAMESDVSIKEVTPIIDNGVQIGYTISFVGGMDPIVLYNGKNGEDGRDGSDGNTPIIGVKQDDDGVWYWTINDDWLLDGDGKKVKAIGVDGKDGEDGKDGNDGKDAIAPQLSIKDDYWYVSTDNGVTWTVLGKATGDDGDQLFKDIRQDDMFVYFVLSNGQTITLHKSGGLKKYGVRWSLSDINDLGSRCFDAIGKTAIIGEGAINGYSDFDTIYPWSDIKRCNIRVNLNGARIVTFEGEPGFTLDGTNGDVFVRIPKFCVDKYRKDGFEYRVVSRSDGNVHPAFIEEGKELNEIFVGAFEGYISHGTLMSISGVIPTSNEVAETYLEAAKIKGEGYTLYDMRSVDAIWTLYAVEYGSRNTNQYLGYGFADFMQPIKSTSNYLTVIESASSTNCVKVPLMDEWYKQYMPVGSNITICDTKQTNILTQAKILSVTDGDNCTSFSFDGPPVNVTTDSFIGSAACTTNFCESCGNDVKLSWHTGRALFVNGDYKEKRNPIRYRWIENIVGSLWHFLPDVSFNDLQMYVCDNIRDYEFYKITNPYRPVGDVLPAQTDNGVKNDVLGVNHWISDLMNDPFSFANVFGKSYSENMTSRQGFGGYYYLNANNVCIVNGGGFDHNVRCNMLTNRAWIYRGYKWYLVGARLMYKNVGE